MNCMFIIGQVFLKVYGTVFRKGEYTLIQSIITGDNDDDNDVKGWGKLTHFLSHIEAVIVVIVET